MPENNVKLLVDTGSEIIDQKSEAFSKLWYYNENWYSIALQISEHPEIKYVVYDCVNNVYTAWTKHPNTKITAKMIDQLEIAMLEYMDKTGKQDMGKTKFIDFYNWLKDNEEV